MRALGVSAILLVSAVASGCGSESIPPETAAALIRESRAVEARLAAADSCGADRRADTLLRLADRAIEAELVPVELAPELRARTARLATEVTCPPPPPPQPLPPPPTVDEEDEGDDGERGKGNGKGRARKKGHDD